MSKISDTTKLPKKAMCLRIMPVTKTAIKTGLSMEQDLTCQAQAGTQQRTERVVDAYIRKIVNIITP